MSSEPTTAFSSSAEDAITRTIDIQPDGPDVESSETVAFEEFYEVERTAKELVQGGYQRVCVSPFSMHNSIWLLLPRMCRPVAQLTYRYTLIGVQKLIYPCHVDRTSISG